MKVAAIQMVSATTVAVNLQSAGRLIAQAARAGAELVLLPEYFCLMGHKDGDKLLVQEAMGRGPIQDFLSQTARSCNLWLVGGTLPISTADPDKVLNACPVYSPQGECMGRYDKIHLFAYDNGRERYDESRVLERGSVPLAFDLPSRDGHNWRIGLSVCYDLRFPELYRALHADLLLVPSAFTWTTGQAHWELLLRARAVENLAYVMAAAQGGRHENGRRTWGHSMLIDPWGQVLQQCDEGEGVVVADLDALSLAKWRAQLPALSHRVL
jgi:nitrilase